MATPELSGMGKARGWASVVAGVLVVVIMALLWVFLIGEIRSGHIVSHDAATSRFLGSTFVAFALVMICGVLGILNGLWQVRYGRRNRYLGFSIIVLFFAALGTVALSGFPK